jgi:Tfp pilus assembly protein PilN
MSKTSSFLPEDYLAQKAERRTNLICLLLFAVVVAGVVFALLLNNQKYNDVKEARRVINARYQEAAQQISELTELEAQKEEMLHKAELAAALVERVPRSILLAELINRMPDRLSLLQFELTSEKLKPALPTKKTDGVGRLKARKAKTMEEAAEELQNKKVRPPRYKVSIDLVGVATTDQEVARYLAELNAYSLLQNVTLIYSEETEIDGQLMREFKFSMTLDPNADVREIEPLIPPRDIKKDPMSDQLHITPPGWGEGTVSADDLGKPEGE